MIISVMFRYYRTVIESRSKARTPLCFATSLKNVPEISNPTGQYSTQVKNGSRAPSVSIFLIITSYCHLSLCFSARWSWPLLQRADFYVKEVDDKYFTTFALQRASYLRDKRLLGEQETFFTGEMGKCYRS